MEVAWWMEWGNEVGGGGLRGRRKSTMEWATNWRGPDQKLRAEETCRNNVIVGRRENGWEEAEEDGRTLLGLMDRKCLEGQNRRDIALVRLGELTFQTEISQKENP